MAQQCGFFDAQLVNGQYDRVYVAEQFAAYFASFIGNGIFGGSMRELEVLAQTSPNMSVNVSSGQAWINGWWYRNTDAYVLSHSVADGVLSRIDIIVVRYDTAQRDIYLKVIEGTPATNPVKPPIRRDADYFDLQLAEVRIPAGSISITQTQITDTRLDNNVCGLVTGVVQQIDTTSLFTQFQTAFREWQDNQQAEYETWTADKQAAYNLFVQQTEAAYDLFVQQSEDDYTSYTTGKKGEFDAWFAAYQADVLDWFEHMKGQLSTDAAVNLQNQIDEIVTELEANTFLVV